MDTRTSSEMTRLPPGEGKATTAQLLITPLPSLHPRLSLSLTTTGDFEESKKETPVSLIIRMLPPHESPASRNGKTDPTGTSLGSRGPWACVHLMLFPACRCIILRARIQMKRPCQARKLKISILFLLHHFARLPLSFDV